MLFKPLVLIFASLLLCLYIMFFFGRQRKTHARYSYYRYGRQQKHKKNSRAAKGSRLGAWVPRSNHTTEALESRHSSIVGLSFWAGSSTLSRSTVSVSPKSAKVIEKLLKNCALWYNMANWTPSGVMQPRSGSPLLTQFFQPYLLIYLICTYYQTNSLE